MLVILPFKMITWWHFYRQLNYEYTTVSNCCDTKYHVIKSFKKELKKMLDCV